MDKLRLLLYNIFSTELVNLNIGHPYNKHNVEKMLDIINTIDYVESAGLSTEEILSILQIYE